MYYVSSVSAFALWLEGLWIFTSTVDVQVHSVNGDHPLKNSLCLYSRMMSRTMDTDSHAMRCRAEKIRLKMVFAYHIPASAVTPYRTYEDRSSKCTVSQHEIRASHA